MSDLPLNAVENKRDDINAKMDPNFGKQIFYFAWILFKIYRKKLLKL